MHLYFAFGSNMAEETLSERGVTANRIGAAFAPGHRLAFTLPSMRWTGRAADLLPHVGGQTWGVVWSLTDEHALDPYEQRYNRVRIPVFRSDTEQPIDAFTYTVKPENRVIPEDLPAPAYVERMLTGARAGGLPSHWLRHLETFRHLTA